MNERPESEPFDLTEGLTVRLPTFTTTRRGERNWYYNSYFRLGKRQLKRLRRAAQQRRRNKHGRVGVRRG